MFELAQGPHRRRNALTGEWVLVSPHRTERPWQGQTETAGAAAQSHYDPSCYLCPGNERAGGVKNPDYTGTFVFENDFAALKPDAPPASDNFESRDLLVARSEGGVCCVMCFTPRHDLTLSTMETGDIQSVIDRWADQTTELGARDHIRHVQVFENRGAAMGASNPHPHCQIWATETIPVEPQKELSAQRTYREARSACLLCDYAALETRLGERVVFENDSFIVVVPFWAVWPFETLVIAKTHAPDLPSLSGNQRQGLADVLRRITTRYDNLFQTSFPYSMGFHQAPSDDEAHPEWHLHAHFYPPLLRSATVRKFMVGFEMLGMPQRDITAESAAERLRDLLDVPSHLRA
ncbi:MAG TPA: UDP-glucose--hexose-1-phosphate uridylyltransferase [Terriglobales bacterium]|nr:UDP-glucose--hexose-1-phosphate uridylyltransferase [Terriglobales bacterium]